MPAVIPINYWSGQRRLSVGQLLWRSGTIPGTTSPMAFRYDPSWLDQGFSLGADLPLVPETLYPSSSGRDQVFGFVRDCMPGSWASLLAPTGPEDASPAPAAADLPERARLFVRAGHPGLRFSALELPLSGPGDGVPERPPPIPRKSLADLLYALSLLTEGEEIPDRYRLLLRRAATDLGGVRPKALLHAGTGLDVTGSWVLRPGRALPQGNPARLYEITARLARSCGLAHADSALLDGPLGGAYLERRVDRAGDGLPLFTLSATTLLSPRPERSGGDDQSATVNDYLAMADLLNSGGSATAADLRELFGRLLFNLLSDNAGATLSHFLFRREDGGWRLCPMFGSRLDLSGQARPGRDPEEALSLCRYFGVSLSRAKIVLMEQRRVLSQAARLARQIGADPAEIEALSQRLS